ncbi:uncharacterized protein VTP21DRAFT_8005 [Calcarisporiella thermophila]|uniref:uncharacterized protein n=1 Tax=Calcarisporiella thermophila TaxID=911321 RepID=UPI003744AEC1
MHSSIPQLSPKTSPSQSASLLWSPVTPSSPSWNPAALSPRSPLALRSPVLPLHSPRGHRRKPSNPPETAPWRLRRPTIFQCFVLFMLFAAGLYILNVGPLFATKDIEQLFRIKEQSVDSEAAPNEVDLRTCGTSPCRFLFPMWIGEGESKAQIHFQQIALLAGQLNRTIVLPNASRGRLGACQKFPFSHYFTNETLVQLKEHFRFISYEAFEAWVQERAPSPTAQFVFIERESSSLFSSWFPPAIPSLDTLLSQYCVKSLRLRHNIFRNFRFFAPSPKQRTEAEIDEVRANLIDRLTQQRPIFSMAHPFYRASPDVMLVRYDLRHPLFDVPVAGPPLNYDHRWFEEAASLARTLRPFIAVHWRMETMDPSVLPTCAHRLAAYLRDLKTRFGMENVYLATDYPLEGRYSHSSTWHLDQMAPDHHRAIRELKSEVDLVSWMTMYDAKTRMKGAEKAAVIQEAIQSLRKAEWPLDESQGHVKKGPKKDLTDDQFDPGLLGILDKLVATQAEYFVTGAVDCAKASSFTAQIARERGLRLHSEMALLPEEGRVLKNIQDYW